MRLACQLSIGGCCDDFGQEGSLLVVGGNQWNCLKKITGHRWATPYEIMKSPLTLSQALTSFNDWRYRKTLAAKISYHDDHHQHQEMELMSHGM